MLSIFTFKDGLGVQGHWEASTMTRGNRVLGLKLVVYMLKLIH